MQQRTDVLSFLFPEPMVSTLSSHRQLPFAQLDQDALDDLQVFGSTTITPSGSLILEGSAYATQLDARGVSNASMEALAPDDALAADGPAVETPRETPRAGQGLRVASDPVLRRGSGSGSGILKRDGQPSMTSARRISFQEDHGGETVVHVDRLQRASADAALTQPLLADVQQSFLQSPARSVPGRVQHSFLQSPLFAQSGRADARRQGSAQLGRLEELQQAVLGTLEGAPLERHSADGGLYVGRGRRDTANSS